MNSFLPHLPLVKEDNRPVISLLDVKLYKLRPSVLFSPFYFNYRHIAFRVLVKDEHLYDDHINRGFFYLHSFCNNQWVAKFGRLFTNFNFKTALIKESGYTVSLFHKNNYLHYSIDPGNSIKENSALKHALMQIDRAYSVNDDRLKVTIVKRENLPLETIQCDLLQTNFFRNPKLLGAYRVKEVLNYEWLPSRNCEFPPTIVSAVA